LVRDSRMEPPPAELLFDLAPFVPGRRQAGSKPSCPSPHLLGLREPLLGQPPAVSGLQGVGETT